MCSKTHSVPKLALSVVAAAAVVTVAAAVVVVVVAAAVATVVDAADAATVVVENVVASVVAGVPHVKSLALTSFPPKDAEPSL